MQVIGLTGFRGVGKTTIADHLVSSHGYTKLHPLAGGKAMVRAWLERAHIPPEDAIRMTDGDLKDCHDPRLPGPVRELMEWVGKAMADARPRMQWTLGHEMRLLEALGCEKVVVESVVYEGPLIHQYEKSVIAYVERPGFKVRTKSDFWIVGEAIWDMLVTNDDSSAPARIARSLAEAVELKRAG